MKKKKKRNKQKQNRAKPKKIYQNVTCINVLYKD